MTIRIYPSLPVPGFPYEIYEEFKTAISEFDSGGEQKRMVRRFPKRTVGPLNYRYLTKADRKIIQNFFQAGYGPFDNFWFVDWIKKDWVDEYVGRGLWYSMAEAISASVYTGINTFEKAEANNSTPNDMTLMPTGVNTIGDSYYFGSDEMFDQLRIFIGTAGVGTYTKEWLYWNGGGWAALSNVSDGSNSFKNSGTVDIKFDRPSNWAKNIIGVSSSCYFIRARTATLTSVTTLPKGNQSWVATRLYDLHSKDTTGGSWKIFLDGALVAEGEEYLTFINGGGGAGADRIRFANAPASGVLITSDFEGYLRIKARFKEDKFSDIMKAPSLFDHQVELYEVHW